MEFISGARNPQLKGLIEESLTFAVKNGMPESKFYPAIRGVTEDAEGNVLIKINRYDIRAHSVRSSIKEVLEKEIRNADAGLDNLNDASGSGMTLARLGREYCAKRNDLQKIRVELE